MHILYIVFMFYMFCISLYMLVYLCACGLWNCCMWYNSFVCFIYVLYISLYVCVYILYVFCICLYVFMISCVGVYIWFGILLICRCICFVCVFMFRCFLYMLLWLYIYMCVRWYVFVCCIYGLYVFCMFLYVFCVCL